MAAHRSPASTGKVSTGAVLTKHLKAMALFVEGLDDEGQPFNRAYKLSDLVWKYALGFEEVDPDNNDKKTRHRPEQWAIMLIFERLEGRSPVATPDSTGKTVADKVSDLGKEKVNALLNKAAKSK